MEQTKKYSLSVEEKKGLMWRSIEKSKLEYQAILIGNDIVDFLKKTLYERLGLDKSQDYPLDEKGENILVPQDVKVTPQKEESKIVTK